MIKQTITITATPDVLFDLSQDYSKRLEWDPFPESYLFLNDKPLGAGLELRVIAKNGFKMDVVYVSFKRPCVAAVKMLKGPFFIARFAGSWFFRRVDEEHTEVVFKYSIETRPSFLSGLVNYVFEKNARQRLSALKNYVECNSDSLKIKI